MYLYTYAGSSLQFNVDFINNYIAKPPFWTVALELIAGLSLFLYAFYTKSKKSIENKALPQKKIVKTTFLSFFILGVTITGIEATTALPYFGALSILFVANYSFLINALLLCGYCLIFVVPPLIILWIASVYKQKFEIIIARLNTYTQKYIPNIVFYGTIVLSIFLISDALMLLV
jgi:hypothetical protein